MEPPVPLPVERAIRKLGGDISLARRRRHISQASLAERMGASLSTVRRMEKGDLRVPIHFFARALHVFGEIQSLENLLDSGARIWTGGFGLTLPIFDAGRNRANLDLAEVRRDLAVTNYEKTVQTAFRDVSDGLIAYQRTRDEAERAFGELLGVSAQMRRVFDRARKRGEPAPIPLSCFCVAKASEGLDYAHRKKEPNGDDLNIVHRDVSPQNILLSYDGEVKVIDFGIARSALRTADSNPNVGFGKFGYMAPEQLLRGGLIDRRNAHLHPLNNIRGVKRAISLNDAV